MAEILPKPYSGVPLTTHRVVVNGDLNGDGDLDDTVVHMVCGSCRPSGRPERRSTRNDRMPGKPSMGVTKTVDETVALVSHAVATPSRFGTDHP